MKLSANISMLFTELPFLDRFAAAAEAGFKGVECWFPYEHEIATLAERLRSGNLELVGINTPPGDVKAGDWGLAAQPGRIEEFRRGFRLTLDYAAALGASGIHVMSGNLPAEGRQEALSCLADNLSYCLELAVGTNATLLLEPLNRRDRANYLLGSPSEVISVLEAVPHPRLKMMYDIYHAQISEGNITGTLKAHLGAIGHIQIASVPARAEPDSGEVDYRYIFSLLEELGWQGWVGAEYAPSVGTLAGLSWMTDLTGMGENTR
jgi:hydroxypyruvate isomerase